MDVYDQNFLVVGTVENAHDAAAGQALVVAPQKVVAFFGGVGAFKAVHDYTLRVDAGKNVLYRAVLSCRVQGLQDNQD